MNLEMDAAASDKARDLTIDTLVNSSQYLTFFLAGEEYGINILDVQEIKGWEGTTIIPNMPPHILGVINLRGTIVPVMDLRKCFNLAAEEFGETTVVIMAKISVDGEERVVGIVVDAVAEVYNVANGDVDPPPAMHAVVDSEYIRGITTLDGKMVILLEISKLVIAEALSDPLASVH